MSFESHMPIVIYLKRYAAWPLLGSMRDGVVYVGERKLSAFDIDRIEAV